MKTLALLLLTTLSLFASQTGQWTQSLDGEWRFTKVFNPIKDDWSPITVPGNWDSTEEHKDHRGIGWYQREFTPDSSLQNKPLRLRFEAVYHEAEVFLNGVRLGSHIGGYTPFEFDVTEKVIFNQPNILTVRADNTYQRGAWWPWGGISRSVNLIANNPLRLVWQHIRTEPDLEAGTAEVFVKYRIENKTDAETITLLNSTLPGDSDPRLKTWVKVAPNSTKDREVSFTLSKDKVRLWHFDFPELYTLNTELLFEGKLQHAISDRFGIRKIEVTPTSFLLNGESVRLVGFNRVSDDHGPAGNTEPIELLRKDIDLMKQAGCNMTRIMHYPQHPDLLRLCDEKGILLICEIPVWQHDPQIIRDNPLTKQWLTEMIHRDYNHPSIIGWSVGNEMYDFYPYAISMMSFIRKELDPHRLVSYVSHLAFQKQGADEPINETDIALINFYNNWAGFTDIVSERWPDKAIFVSEFGHKQEKPNGHFMDGFEEMWHKLTTDRPRLVGVSLWTFNDYRSDYKGTPEHGYRTWGVVDEKRNLKPCYYTIRKLYSPLQVLKVDDGTLTVQTRQPTQTPSYPLRGYKVLWENGELAGELKLPTLHPGDPAHTQQLPSEAGPTPTLHLITPLGYKIDDTKLNQS
ncbi:glycoside hydrolase family 2 protein [Roseibacillus persicicus]|uniref:glycoside hydrolase family 2 protein n=1 Tax=Roseibacillus persicicus TaxID=454148 RepID=UPI00280D0A1D|nr:glycoside hydrolase family 2 TIM barrel-domain containing protein [Roseibacillus persicicus]MDQ8192296.1 glycoside hydrolase family 2 TIM barrel-domain containing protein [Roseibacillus persicicus]